MKRSGYGLALLSVCIALPAWADLFQDGEDAYANKDYATALHDFRPLADKGDARAEFILGVMYANGLGVPQDDKEAVKWFRLAADQGTAGAQYSLGLMYANGLGVPRDHKEAVKWYRLAADQGHASAQTNLGAMYAHGQGVPQDDVMAYALCNLASSSAQTAATNRQSLITRMTQAQIEQAQELTRQMLRPGNFTKAYQARIETIARLQRGR